MTQHEIFLYGFIFFLAVIVVFESGRAYGRKKAYDEARDLYTIYAIEMERNDPLSFRRLAATNKLRCESAFHSIESWKPWEWSNAMAGEAGEACNITKKMNRIWPANQYKQAWNKPEDQRMAELEARCAEEIGDVVIYADLLAQRIGFTLEQCVVSKFNSKSVEIGSTIQL